MYNFDCYDLLSLLFWKDVFFSPKKTSINKLQSCNSKLKLLFFIPNFIFQVLAFQLTILFDHNPCDGCVCMASKWVGLCGDY
jgi:hypothetical protein